jgi:hypothetical protein
VLDIVPHLEAFAVILFPFHDHSSFSKDKVFRLYAEFNTSVAGFRNAGDPSSVEVRNLKARSRGTCGVE